MKLFSPNFHHMDGNLGTIETETTIWHHFHCEGQPSPGHPQFLIALILSVVQTLLPSTSCFATFLSCALSFPGTLQTGLFLFSHGFLTTLIKKVAKHLWSYVETNRYPLSLEHSLFFIPSILSFQILPSYYKKLSIFIPSDFIWCILFYLKISTPKYCFLE